jgi:hypothetical protein
VAVGGNRVQNMTVEQIAQAFAAGQLTVRTPLWPPGTSGWQALGNFEQFTQSGTFAQPGYGQLSQFEEADDDPTRMWTGSADLSELPGMGMDPVPMDPVPPMPLPPPMESRPSARTGPRQVSTRAPAVRSVPAPPVARPPSMPPAAIARAMRPRRSSGLWLVAGLVGLVGLGSAVLAARGTSSVAAPTETVASATPSPEPSHGATPSAAEAPKAEAPKAEEPKAADAPAAAASNGAQPEATAKADAPASEVNQARLAKYDDSSASAFVAEGQPAKDTAAKDTAASQKPSSEKAEKADVSDAVATKPARERSSKVSSMSKHSAKTAAHEAKAEPHVASVAKEPKEPVAKEAKPAKEPAAKEAKPAKEAKAEAPASSAVNEAAATALGNSAKLASSCRPRGGPAGEGKARVIYSNDGEVQSVEILTAKFRDTLTGSCVKMVFRRAKIAPFKGEPPTFIKSFTIPEE